MSPEFTLKPKASWFKACNALSIGEAFGSLLGAVCVLVISGCSNDTLPIGAMLTVTPEQHNTEIVEQKDAAGRCVYYPGNTMDIPVILQLNTVNGSPIGGATLKVYLGFGANTYHGLPVLALYDDLNGNGVVDEESELVSGLEDDIAQVMTGKWTGARSLLLRINLSCSFRGELFAYTAGVSVRAEIEVTASATEDVEMSGNNEWNVSNAGLGTAAGSSHVSPPFGHKGEDQ